MNTRYCKLGASVVLALCATTFAIPRARAELMLYDKEGWTLKHDGLAQGFYSLTMGDSVPKGDTPVAPQGWGGWDSPPADDDGDFLSSRFRSGWTGARFNWVAAKQVSENTSVSAVLGIAFAISTDNGPTRTNNNWDVRSAFVKIDNKHWGDVLVGRHVGLYTLGGIISTMQATSAALGLGNACGSLGDGLGCYTSGYGAKFPGFWAGIQYQTPSFAGLRIKVAALDPVTAGVDAPADAPPGTPSISVAYNKRPLPMFQTLIRYEGDFGGFKLVPYFNGFAQTVGRAGTDDTLTPMGGGAGLDFAIGGFHAGAGGTLERGTSFYGPLYTPSSVIDGDEKLRKGSSFYVHALYSFDGIVDINAGYGQTNIKPTSFDSANDFNVQTMQSNIYGAVQYHWEKLVTFMAEVNVLRHKWDAGNKQNVQLYNLGMSFSY
jgi:predicted porin